MPIDDAERERRRYSLLWEGQQRGTRGRKPSLALSDLVQAGISIADAEGLEAVSMNRIARSVGSGVMSLYRYVPGKDELVDLMVESVLGEIDYPDPPPQGWRARLEVSARREWRMYRRHPWVLQVVSTVRLPMGPHMVRDVDWMLWAVDELDCDADTKLWLVMMVMAYVQGAGLLLTGERNAAGKGEAGAQEWWDAREPELRKRIEAIGATTLAKLTSELSRPLDLDTWFEFGLQRTLDGIEVLAAR
jgi:AcrR family transcriptional regulator